MKAVLSVLILLGFNIAHAGVSKEERRAGKEVSSYSTVVSGKENDHNLIDSPFPKLPCEHESSNLGAVGHNVAGVAGSGSTK